MDAIFESYVKMLEAADRDTGHIRTTERMLEAFDAWLKSEGLAARSVTHEHVVRYVQGALLTKYARSTAEQRLKPIKAAYKLARAMGTLRSDPTTMVSRFLPKVRREIPETLSGDEIRRGWEAAQRLPEWEPMSSEELAEINERDPQFVPSDHAPRVPSDYSAGLERDAMMFELFALTGLRKCEARAVLWERERAGDTYLDLAENQIVVGWAGKGAKPRYVPLHPYLRERLEHYRENASLGNGRYVIWTRCRQSLSQSQMQSRMGRIWSKAGLRPRKPTHVFRASGNSDLTRRGVRPDVIEQIFGWGPSSVRSRYYTGLATEDTQEAIKLLYADCWPLGERTNEPEMVGALRQQIRVQIEALQMQLAALPA